MKLRVAKTPFFLTSRRLWRGNKGTIVLTIFLMALAFNNINFVNSLINGLIAGTNDQVINKINGHLTIEPGENARIITGVESLVDDLLLIDNITGVSPRVTVAAEIVKGNRRSGWQTFAIEPELEKQVTTLADNMLAGEFLASGDKYQIVLGKQLRGGEGLEFDAYSLQGVEIGETVVLTLPSGLEQEFVVKGIFNADFVQADIRAFIPIAAWEELFPQTHDQAQIIAVRLADDGLQAETISRIKDIGADINVFTWEDTAGMIKSVTDSLGTINIMITSIGLLVAGVTVFIVIYVDVINKRREIGILRAIGIRGWVIWSSYILQAVVYSLLGIGLGALILHFGLIPYFQNHPLRFPLGNVSLVADYHNVFGRALLLIGAAIVAGFLPAYRATRSKLLDAIWG